MMGAELQDTCAGAGTMWTRPGATLAFYWLATAQPSPVICGSEQQSFYWTTWKLWLKHLSIEIWWIGNKIQKSDTFCNLFGIISNLNLTLQSTYLDNSFIQDGYLPLSFYNLDKTSDILSYKWILKISQWNSIIPSVSNHQLEYDVHCT